MVYAMATLVVAVGLSLVCMAGPGWALGGEEESVTARAEVWYVPVEEHFRAAYETDTANRAKQSWDEYWGWVSAFYKGNFLATGWDERSRTLLTCVEPRDRQKVLRAKLNAVGRELCQEWAKDSRVRKISSSDLIQWGKELDRARERDSGRGDQLEKELDRIHSEVKRKKMGS
jgi:hypothetical protein